MQFFFNTKPLSTNKLFRGRRFRTREYDVYEKELLAQVPRGTKTVTGEVEVIVEVFLSKKTYGRCDVDNFFKGLLDSLTKAKLWEDDKKIVALHGYKYLCETVKKEGVRVTIAQA